MNWGTLRNFRHSLGSLALLIGLAAPACGQASAQGEAAAGKAGVGNSGAVKSGVGAVEAAAPTSADPRSAVRIVTDQRFSDQPGKAGLCDLFCPTTDPPVSGHPVVIVVHGGGWMSGDKWTLRGYAQSLAESGFVAMTINYRLAPTHKFPAQVDDVRAAMLWIKRNAKRFDVDIDRLGIFGYSAGGHLSALVASLADESIAVRAGASQWGPSDQRWNELPTIRAVCAGGPPCDFRSIPIDNPTLAFFLGGSRREKPEAYVAASPSAHVSAGDPVTQIIHGETDILVPIEESRQFHQLQRAVGIDSRLEVMPKQGHMVTFLNPKTNQKMLEFFQEVLRNRTENVSSLP